MCGEGGRECFTGSVETCKGIVEYLGDIMGNAVLKEAEALGARF